MALKKESIMVYLEKLAVCVVSGKGIVAEQDVHSGESTVRLPFGTDYGLRIKNLNTQDAVVSISIDGKDVLDNDQIVIKANSEANLDGFMDNGKVRSAFRFIEKTKEISDYRGDNIDDGIIRIEWQWVQKSSFNDYVYRKNPLDIPRPYWDQKTGDNSYLDPDPWKEKMFGAVPDNMNIDITDQCVATDSSILRGQNLSKNSFNDNGITVEGEDVNQDFQYTNVGPLESEKHVIIMHIKGKDPDEQKPVQKVMLTNTKIRCKTCGKRHRSNLKFCSNCGTKLPK